ncbi:hypothetical protein Tco_1323904, partial [Tanacetum coccineum]
MQQIHLHNWKIEPLRKATPSTQTARISAAQAALKDYKEALKDAKTSLILNSKSAEGYSRIAE